MLGGLVGGGVLLSIWGGLGGERPSYLRSWRQVATGLSTFPPPGYGLLCGDFRTGVRGGANDDVT